MAYVKLELPYPISVNSIYGYNWNRKYIYLTPEVKAWYKEVTLTKKCYDKPIFITPVVMIVYHFPPDNGKHDKDNILKITQDVLEPKYLNVVKNDNLIYPCVYAGEVLKGGKLVLEIYDYPYETITYEEVKDS